MTMTRGKEIIAAVKYQEVELLRDHITGKAGSIVKLPIASAKSMVEDMGIAKYKGKPQEVKEIKEIKEEKQIESPKNKQIKSKKTKK